MWELDNRTPFAADSGWIRDSDGAEVWIVAVKATYDILPDGNTRIASQQVPVYRGPVFHDDLRSLRYDIDLGPPKPATDVLLNGHAYAQGTLPVEELHVGFRVGSMKRLAKVSGDRYWQRGILFSSPSKPVPFVRMPLVYERAFGGDALDAEHSSGNPLGRGIEPDADGRVWLPNVEALDKPIHHRGARPQPMSFGPLPSHWLERRQYAGTYDDAWLEQRHPLPPQDLDPRHWQLAPAAQQVDGRLRGGEEVVLVNLTPPGYAADGRLSFRLPKLTLAFQTYFTDGKSIASRSTIHSLILEPDHPRVSIVHHMALPCHEHINRLDKTRILQKQRPLDLPFSPVHADLEWPASDDQEGADQ
ncbi:hypothetical protein RB25_24750 [Herbaspirillum rubrisubalbicans]|uniref:DUF2169 domain-containing protein n=1 Tax=Herbaspirillum rubrisubalbicans TaxID=80842 RepID=A0ABX9BV15_9BURK|nr:DUF2169 domain-containing protein [Herbaspirillum rubrisubalbicans]RAM61573.1 hypothetical protein RB24_24790 [Herbaspirillum rubrisubalbicans]RAN42963.1 hypothetical protein RB25_24750 [Herbaspirillum rubrisubalbicans]